MSTNSPRVSVILPTHNRDWSIERAVESVLQQQYRDFELIVVDDGSTDDTSARLQKYRDKASLLAQENRGVGAARNAGIREADGQLIAFLDSDDEWLPAKLACQLQFMHEHPDYRICQTLERWIRHGRFVNIPNVHKKVGGQIFAQSLKKCMVSSSSVMMQRSLLDEVGFFNESLPACEDYDLWLRIACKYPIGLIEQEHLIRYGGHEDQLSSRFSGNDRYRIRAIMNTIENCALSPEQEKLAIKELAFKCRVYGNGCKKRGRIQEGERFLRIPSEKTFWCKTRARAKSR